MHPGSRAAESNGLLGWRGVDQNPWYKLSGLRAHALSPAPLSNAEGNKDCLRGGICDASRMRVWRDPGTYVLSIIFVAAAASVTVTGISYSPS